MPYCKNCSEMASKFSRSQSDCETCWNKSDPWKIQSTSKPTGLKGATANSMVAEIPGGPTSSPQWVRAKFKPRWGFHGLNLFRNVPPMLDWIGIVGIWRPGQHLELLRTFIGAFLSSSCSVAGRIVQLEAYLVSQQYLGGWCASTASRPKTQSFQALL